jgi:hypothetical protein
LTLVVESPIDRLFEASIVPEPPHAWYSLSAGEMAMANRKQFLGEPALDPELMELLAKARQKPVTDAELHEQRISFAFGNSPDSQYITKDSVRKASESILLMP